MTIRFITAWNGYKADDIVSGLSNEATLISAGIARTDLDGDNDGEKSLAKWSLDASGNLSLIGPDGEYLSNLFSKANHAAGPGESLYVFNDHTAVTGVSTPTLSTSTTITWNGQPTVSVGVSSAGGTVGVSKATLSTPLRNKSIILPVYVEDYTKLEKIQVFISQDGTPGSNYVQYNYTIGDVHKFNGWHLYEVTENQFTAAGAGVVADGTAVTFIRVDVKATAGNTCGVYLGEARLNVRSRPVVIFTFDDARASVIKQTMPIMQKYNIKGTAYVIPPRLGTSTYMAESDLSFLHDLGWCIANHAYNVSGTSDSYAEIGLANYVAEVEQCRDWLEARGYTGAQHHAYVEGSYDGTLAAALALVGIKTARTIAGNVSTGAQAMCTNYGVQRRMALMGGLQLNSSNAVAAVKTEVDRAIRDGRTLIITGHDVFSTAEGGAGEVAYLNTDFEDLVAYVASKRGAGLCDVMTVDQWAAVLVK